MSTHSRSKAATGRGRRKEETRRRVYLAALHVFRRDGVAESRIDEITRVAGVSRGTFYFHFPSKDDVLLQLYSESEERVVDRIMNALQGKHLADDLEVVSCAIAAEWQEDPSLFPEMGAVALKHISFGKPAVQSQPIRIVLADMFLRAEKSGELDRILPAELLSDLYLVNLLATTIIWCGNPVLPLQVALAAVSRFFNRAATRDEIEPPDEPDCAS